MTINEAKKIIVEEYVKALKNDTSVGGGYCESYV